METTAPFSRSSVCSGYSSRVVCYAEVVALFGTVARIGFVSRLRNGFSVCHCQRRCSTMTP
eukprot:409428-Pyramimonas_sp.AAC.1